MASKTPAPIPGADAATVMSKNARKRANKKLRELEEETPAKAAPAPEQSVAASKVSPQKPAAKQAAAAPAPKATTPAPKATSAAPKATGAAPKSAAPAPKAAATPVPKAGGTTASTKAAAPAKETPGKATTKAAAGAPNAKATGGAAKGKAAPKATGAQAVVQQEGLQQYTLDDGSGAAWEVATGINTKIKKQQAKKEALNAEESSVKPAAKSAAQSARPASQSKGKGRSKGSTVDLEAVAAAARAEVASLLEAKKVPEEAPTSTDKVVTVIVPEGKVSRVIGPKGAKIRQIQERTKVRIDTYQEVFTISGDASAVELAKAAIEELAEKGYNASMFEDFSEGYVMVHPNYIPEIIGKRGSMIQWIKDQLSVEIDVPSNRDASQQNKKAKVKVTIAGSAKNVEKTKAVINDIMMYGHHELTHPNEVHEELEVEQSAYSRIIGRFGAELRNIEGKYKVRVVIPREHSINQKILIIGEQEAVNSAKAHVEKKIYAEQDQAKTKNEGAETKDEEDQQEEQPEQQAEQQE